MPELPEVESLVRAVRTMVIPEPLRSVKFFRSDLRYPIPVKKIQNILTKEPIQSVERRSKYMQWATAGGVVVFHLGMSGRMLDFSTNKPQEKHTHAIFEMSPGRFLHFIDPRRFGIIDYCSHKDLPAYKFFKDLGPEPLTSPDLGQHLFQKSRNKKISIKTFIMDAHQIVGVGNIYASEALFRAGIHPETPAMSLPLKHYERLSKEICQTLKEAIAAGGTTFRDYQQADGNPGYFKVALNVYERADQPCNRCQQPIRTMRQSGRATYFCAHCQTIAI